MFPLGVLSSLAPLSRPREDKLVLAIISHLGEESKGLKITNVANGGSREASVLDQSRGRKMEAA